MRDDILDDVHPAISNNSVIQVCDLCVLVSQLSVAFCGGSDGGRQGHQYHAFPAVFKV
jgi:hypothetical protein